MTARDRIVIMTITVLVLLGAGWKLVVSPERAKVGKLESQVSAAQAKLQSAEQSAASGQAAQAQYAKAYASVVRLGKAVPPTAEVPSLLYELAQASDRKKVELSSISTTSSGSASPAPGTPAVTATPTAFTALPFTFVFEGGFFQLEHLFRQLAQLTTFEGSNDVQVSGRLLTIDSVKLAPATNGSGGATASGGKLTGTVTATAYALPAGEGLTPGAGASAPTSPSAAGATSSAASSAPPAAIVKAGP